MYDMNRRLKKAEKKLSLDNKTKKVVIIKTFGDKEGFDLSNPVGGWLTYPEALERSGEQIGLIVLSEGKEIAARGEQLKATKRQII